MMAAEAGVKTVASVVASVVTTGEVKVVAAAAHQTRNDGQNEHSEKIPVHDFD